MKIDFDEEKHEYSVGGIRIPSVSEILSPLSAERYGDLNPWMLKAAAAKGTAVHEACELIDYDCETEEDPETDGYIKAYLLFLMEHAVEWSRIESVVGYYRNIPFSETEDGGHGELPLYCGTIDRYGKIDGQAAVVDLKTYASLSTDAQLAASCQTALYEDAIRSEDVDADAQNIRRYILHLKKDGTYRLVDLNDWDNKHGFNSRETAWMLWNVWNNKDKAKKTNRKGKK